MTEHWDTFFFFWPHFFLLPIKLQLLEYPLFWRNFCMPWSMSLLDFSVPKMQFKERAYTGRESDGQIVAVIHRSGDIQYQSSVRCYTRQGSAQVMMDFEERPNTDISKITFLPGMFELEMIKWFWSSPESVKIYLSGWTV